MSQAVLPIMEREGCPVFSVLRFHSQDAAAEPAHDGMILIFLQLTAQCTDGINQGD
jgi:hypothetical protein